MSNNRYYKQVFKKDCGEIVEKYVWSNDIEKGIYPVGLTPIILPKNTSSIQIGKMTTSQIQADRKKRSVDHFKRDVLPSLGKDEQRHFHKKYKNQ